MGGCINQLIEKMLRKVLAKICHIEMVKCFRDFTIVNILG